MSKFRGVQVKKVIFLEKLIKMLVFNVIFLFYQIPYFGHSILFYNMVKKFAALCFIFLISTSLSQSADYKFLKTLNKNEYPLWDKTMIGTSASVYVAMPLSVMTIAA